jgi:hypothetical protein
MFPALLALAGAAQTGGGILQAAMGFANAGETRAVNRERMRMLRSNADMQMATATGETNRVRDQLDAVTGTQAGFFAGGNIDPTSGSPAFVAAQSAAQAELDVLAGTARGLQGRADAFGQIANVAAQTADAQRGALIGAGTAFLSSVSNWASLGLQAGRGAASGPGPSISSGPMRLQGAGSGGGGFGFGFGSTGGFW